MPTSEQCGGSGHGRDLAITTMEARRAIANRCRRHCRRQDCVAEQSTRPTAQASYQVHEQGCAKWSPTRVITAARAWRDERECSDLRSVPTTHGATGRQKGATSGGVRQPATRGRRAGQSLLRGGELLERPFRASYETGAMRSCTCAAAITSANECCCSRGVHLALILRSITKPERPKGLGDLKRKIVLALLRVLALSGHSLRLFRVYETLTIRSSLIRHECAESPKLRPSGKSRS